MFQGGGALGAYQAGVYQALHDAKVEPDWVIGTSIGAINGAIIAGNPRDERLARLTEFWDRVAYRHASTSWLPNLDDWLRNVGIVTKGIPAFFTPRIEPWFGLHARVGLEQAAFYSTGAAARDAVCPRRFRLPEPAGDAADGRHGQRL